MLPSEMQNTPHIDANERYKPMVFDSQWILAAFESRKDQSSRPLESLAQFEPRNQSTIDHQMAYTPVSPVPGHPKKLVKSEETKNVNASTY
jgi:hypothetical protein